LNLYLRVDTNSRALPAITGETKIKSEIVLSAIKTLKSKAALQRERKRLQNAKIRPGPQPFQEE